VQSGQRGVLGSGEGLDLFPAGLDLAVDAFQLGDQLGGEPPAGLAGNVTRPGGREQGTGLCRGQESLRPAGHQVQQQPVDPVDGLGAGPAELVAPVGQQAQCHPVRGDLELDQVRGPQSSQGHGVRAGWVGLAAVAGGEDPYLRRQPGGHIQDRLAIGDEPVRDVPAGPVAALNRPDPVTELPPGPEHFRIASLVSAIPAHRHHLGPVAGHPGLCGSIPMIMPTEPSPCRP
jgi:hypothetical protein